MIRWFFRLAARLGYTCRRASEHYTDLAEGALSPEDARQMRVHLRLCPACKAFRGQMDVVTLALKNTAPEPLPPAERDQLVALFRSRR